MKLIAASVLIATVAAQGRQSIPSQTLSPEQQSARASLEAAQASLLAQASQHIANDQASHSAAIESDSHVVHGNRPGESESFESESDMSGLDSEENSESDNGASGSTAASFLAIAAVVGAAMF